MTLDIDAGKAAGQEFKRDTGRLDDAFHELMRLIGEEGMEFPDATMRVCRKFDVRSADLRAMYDELG